jgi:hypothetical protein
MYIKKMKKKIFKSSLHCLKEDKIYCNILNGVEHQYLFLCLVLLNIEQLYHSKIVMLYILFMQLISNNEIMSDNASYAL